VCVCVCVCVCVKEVTSLALQRRMYRRACRRWSRWDQARANGHGGAWPARDNARMSVALTLTHSGGRLSCGDLIQPTMRRIQFSPMGSMRCLSRRLCTPVATFIRKFFEFPSLYSIVTDTHSMCLGVSPSPPAPYGAGSRRATGLASVASCSSAATVRACTRIVWSSPEKKDHHRRSAPHRS
jgi:hypothetical protein